VGGYLFIDYIEEFQLPHQYYEDIIEAIKGRQIKRKFCEEMDTKRRSKRKMKDSLCILSIYSRSIKSIYLQLKTKHVLREEISGGIKIRSPFAAPVFLSSAAIVFHKTFVVSVSVISYITYAVRVNPR
jgi:hypothetical protein